MSFISSQDRRTLITVFITLLIICEMVAYVANTPRPREQFFQLYVLGAHHMAADYYPNNRTDLSLGEPVTWYLGVTDNMGSVQLVSIRVKIGNQTINPPDDQQAIESPAPVVAEYMRVLQDNETWEMPLIWSVSGAVSVNGSTRILALQFNNETYQLQDCSASGGHNFRLIFELWTLQTEANAFEFSWKTGDEHRIAWLQVWFNMTSPRLA
jgi:uncharacterized membrane protein